MAFKMKRGSLKLGHNRQIKPIVTRFAGDGIDDIGWGSPFHQEVTELEKRPDVEDVTDQSIDINTDGQVIYNAETGEGGSPGVEVDQEKSTNRCGYEVPWDDPQCVQYAQLLEDRKTEPCKNFKCPDGATPTVEGDECKCMTEGGEGNLGKWDESFTKEHAGRETNILTPHQARRNQRMVNVIGRSAERKKAAANRRVRRALRRGGKPGPEDMAILSGATDSDLSVFNLAEDSPHTRNMMGVDLGQHNQGVAARPYSQEEFKALESKLINESGYEAGSAKLYDAMKAYEAGGAPKDIKAGQYMDAKTRRMYEKYGMDVPGGGSTVSQGTRKLQGKLKRKGISAKKKARIQKRIDKRAKRGK